MSLIYVFLFFRVLDCVNCGVGVVLKCYCYWCESEFSILWVYGVMCNKYYIFFIYYKLLFYFSIVFCFLFFFLKFCFKCVVNIKLIIICLMSDLVRDLGLSYFFDDIMLNCFFFKEYFLLFMGKIYFFY